MNETVAKRLQEKIAVITGAANGMGRETALEFLRQGAKVVVADINGAELASAVQEGELISPYIKGVQCDLTVPAECEKLINAAVDSFGRIDVLFNNLGVNLAATLHETTVEQWDYIFSVNVRSMFLTCKYALPIMMSQNNGVIINTSSSGGMAALRGLCAYSASKGAVLSLTRSIALDYAPYNIRANALIPGVIMTKMTEKVIEMQPDPETYADNMRNNNPLRRFGTENEIAMAAVFLASDECSFMTGSTLIADGGYLAQ